MHVNVDPAGLLERPIGCTGVNERLAVMSDGLCVGHCIFHAQAKETHKGKSVRDLKLHLGRRKGHGGFARQGS